MRVESFQHHFMARFLRGSIPCLPILPGGERFQPGGLRLVEAIADDEICFRVVEDFDLHDTRLRMSVAGSDGAIAARLATAPAQSGLMDFLDFRTALQKLPADQREALILIGASGLSYEEAAGGCNCAVGTMKSRVDRKSTRLNSSHRT